MQISENLRRNPLNTRDSMFRATSFACLFVADPAAPSGRSVNERESLENKRSSLIVRLSDGYDIRTLELFLNANARVTDNRLI